MLPNNKQKHPQLSVKKNTPQKITGLPYFTMVEKNIDFAIKNIKLNIANYMKANIVFAQK